MVLNYETILDRRPYHHSGRMPDHLHPSSPANRHPDPIPNNYTISDLVPAN